MIPGYRTAALTFLVTASSWAASDAAVRAGAWLAAGNPAEAAAAAGACHEPACRLVQARALFALGRLKEAAAAASNPGDLGSLAPYAQVLRGEALLLAGDPAGAVDPLRQAAAVDGAASLRAAALLADALLASHDFAGARQAASAAAALPGQPVDVKAAMAWVAAQALHAEPGREHEAAEALRNFWLQHPEHPAAETARSLQRELAIALPEPSGRDLLLRASRLLAAGQPGAAVAQAEVAAKMLSGEDRAEALLLQARALAADGRRADAGPSLEQAWRSGNHHVRAVAGMLLARDRARRGREAEAIRIADAVAKRFRSAPEAEESVLFTARLLADSGKRKRARARLARLARKRSGSNASLARWTLAWMSYQDHLHDAAKRFAEYVASASSDDERAQGLYWQARTCPANESEALFRRAAELDPLGWYGLLARERLGNVSDARAPFPPLRVAITSGIPQTLAMAAELATLGFLAEAAAEADWFVQRHAGDAGAAALPIYELAGRADRAVLLAIALLGDRGPRAPAAVLEGAYPTAFPEQVARAAERTGLDPYLLLAVIRRESLFKADVRSAAGAVGLLQLLPATARRAAAVLGRPPLRDEQLVDPATAIDLGAWYLSELVGRFGEPTVALAAYNAGPRVVGPWAARGADEQLDEWVESIPYRETRRYVKAVMGAWSAYRILAGGSPPRLSETVPAPKAGAQF